ncbi:MAG: 2,4-dihydroxyhept-2-ene-1,7-dioic acid aldolase [Caldilinea sp.]|jgi:4-hydroxy-2-oxoheptanedioate aldolase|nr:2,4-dihydroxyhept-2-ene-1,7-dioic acid aldolase [Caldilinea sp.]
MRENRLRTLWQQGAAALCAWLSIPSTFSAEIVAHAGFDCLTIDLQHGLIDYSSAAPMLQAISTTNATPLARVPWNDPGTIMKLLDAGCYGIICPMINNADEAAAFAAACRYPPAGIRSYGPKRAMLYAGDDYADAANATVLAIAMIETADGLANVDAIAALPGIDALYIGPADLSLALGRSQRVDQTDPVMVEALDAILAAAKRHGKVAGLHTATPAYAAAMIEKGFQLVTVSTDAGFLETEARRVARAVRGDGAAHGAKGPY